VHELGLCDAVVAAALRRAGERRVTAMRVRIGGHPVDPDVVRQGIALVAAGTAADGVDIDLVLEPMHVRCPGCGDSPVLDHLAMVACPRCGGIDIELIGDERVVLESIELEPAPR
jgi:hydrogenase nickel incorporation protein HypA/HybF